MFNDKSNTKNITEEWLTIGLGHSQSGNVYAYATGDSQEDIDKYYINNPYVKIFDEDYEGFMIYMRWFAKLGPWFTMQSINKEK